MMHRKRAFLIRKTEPCIIDDKQKRTIKLKARNKFWTPPPEVVQNNKRANSILVTSRIFEWNTLESDLLKLYGRLVNWGVKYHNGAAYLPEVNNTATDS